MPRKGQAFAVGKRREWIQLPDRYDESEWSSHTKYVRESVAQHCETAEKIIDDSKRKADEVAEVNDRLQSEVSWFIDKRTASIKEWTDILTNKYNQCVQKEDDLKIFIRRCESLLNSFPDHLKTNAVICSYREKRESVELVDDEPHKELHKEIRLIHEYEKKVEESLAGAKEMQRLLRKFYFQLNNDIKAKKEALCIENHVRSLNEHHPDVATKECKLNAVNMENFIQNEKAWEKNALELKVKADKLLSQSEKTCSDINLFLIHTREVFQKQVDDTNFAFEKRAVDVKRDKEIFEESHLQISERIRSMQESIGNMIKAYEQARSSLQLAKAQFTLRNKRPERELIRDEAHIQIETEVQRMEKVTEELEYQVNLGKMSLKKLAASQVQLEDAINLKLQALSIDEIQVMPLRKTISIELH